MSLNDQDRARVAEIEAYYMPILPWERELDSDNKRARQVIRDLLSLIRRLSEGPEVVKRICATCVWCRPSDKTNRMFCTYHGDDGEFETYENDWCSNYGRRKEPGDG